MPYFAPFRRLTHALVPAVLLGICSGAQAAQHIQESRIGSAFDVYRITEPTVNRASTRYPSVVFRANDQVSVSAGGCVQTGGRSATWKRYVDPSGPNADRLYHGRIQLPGHPVTSLQEVIGQIQSVAAGTLSLYYDDDGYSDNGYSAHDDGTDGQCRGVGAAWVVVVVHHPAGAPGSTPIPPTSGVSGLPVLTTDIHNPPHDTSSPSWSSSICHGQRWLANGLPRYEWTNVYDPVNQFDDDAAGLSGMALFPQDVEGNNGLSLKDISFTHPFNYDWETFIAPDPAYTDLLAPSNLGRTPTGAPIDGEYLDAVARANTLGLTVPRGVMGTETDQGLIPLGYRAQEGDRVALFGRWIVDCGHEDFHTEIHPPLLFVRAQAIPAATNPDALPNHTAGGLATQTYSRVIGRPYLVGQEFGDGALRSHLITEAIKAVYGVGPFAKSNRIEAHPLMSAKPFSAIHLFSYVVRAPVLQPTGHIAALQPSVLMCTFHFTVRTGVTVQVVREGVDSVRVYVAMNAATYRPPPLPVRQDLNVPFSQLKRDAPEAATDIDLALALGAVTRGPFDWLIARGILTDRYAAPIAASIHDGEIIQTPVNALAGRQFSVDDDQPFPVYGWLSLEWQLQKPSIQPVQPVVPMQPVVPVQPVVP